MLESVEVAHLRRYCQHTSLIRVSPSTTGRSLKGNIYIAPEQIEHAGTGHLVVLTHTHKLKTDTESMQRRTCAVTGEDKSITSHPTKHEAITRGDSLYQSPHGERCASPQMVQPHPPSTQTQKPVWSFRQAPVPRQIGSPAPTPRGGHKNTFLASPPRNRQKCQKTCFLVFLPDSLQRHLSDKTGE